MTAEIQVIPSRILIILKVPLLNKNIIKFIKILIDL